MSNSSNSRLALTLAAAAAAALPSLGLAVDTKTFTAGAAQNSTAYLTATNWDTGVIAGLATTLAGGTAPSTNGAADDIAQTAAVLKLLGFGINFGSTGLNGGSVALGAIIHNSTALGSTGTGTTLTFGNTGTAGLGGGTTITGTVALGGSTVNVGATGGTLNNIVAAISDSATTNISLTNQSANTAPGTTTVTYQLNGADAGFYATAGRTLRVIGPLVEQTAGATTVQKYGAGTLELGSQLNGVSSSAVNTFSNLTINQGLVIVDGGLNSIGSPSGVVTIRNGSELRFNFNSINLAATKTFVLDNGGVINNNTYVATINGVISGTGGLTKTGTSSLTLNASNSFTGGLTIGNGTTASTVTIGTAAAVGATSSVTTINNLSTLAFNAVSGATQTLASGRTFNLAGATGTLNVTSGETWTMNGTVTGPGRLVKTGTGFLNLGGPTSYTGGTTVSAGNLYINSDQTGVATGAATVATGAQLAGSGVIGATSIAVGGVITPGTSGNVVSTLVANGNVTLTDGVTAGTFKHDFSTTNSTHDDFTVLGDFNIAGGTLQLTNLAAAGDASYVLATAGTLSGGSFTTVTGLVGGYTLNYTGNQISLTRGNTNLYFTGSQGTDLATVNSGVSNFTTDAGGTLATDQTPTASADVYFNAGANTTAGNLATTIAANTFVNSLTFGTGQNAATPVSITGTNTLAVKAAGIGYATGTGIVIGSGAGAVTLATPVSISAGQSQSWTTNAASPFIVSGTVALGANTLTLAGTGNTALAGVVSGTGGLTKSGTGTATLTAANTYTGTTTVALGTLRANAAASSILLSGAGGVDVQGGKLLLDYAGGTSPVATVKAILDGGFAGNFAAGQIRGTVIPVGQTIGYGDNGVDAVTVRLTLPGDADLDGDVDFNDFLSLQTNFGTAGTRFDQGNFNYDGATNFNDFLALQTNFGQSVGGGAVAFTSEEVAAVTAFGLTAAVPEPASLALLGLGASALLRRRRA